MNIQKQNEITVENFIKDLRAYGRNVAHELVKEGGERLQKRYDNLIERFYNEYDPIVYDRWNDLGKIDYLYYKNKSSMTRYIDSRFRESLVLDPDKMDLTPRYNKTPRTRTKEKSIVAFEVSMKGIHGTMKVNNDNGIYAHNIIKDLETRRNAYIRHINHFANKCISNAQTKYTYNIIKFK